VPHATRPAATTSATMVETAYKTATGMSNNHFCLNQTYAPKKKTKGLSLGLGFQFFEYSGFGFEYFANFLQISNKIIKNTKE